MKPPICVNCNREYTPHKNGTLVIEYAEFGAYKIWSADMWMCPECDHKVIVGFGALAISEHYEKGFKKLLDKIKEDAVKSFYKESIKSKYL